LVGTRLFVYVQVELQEVHVEVQGGCGTELDEPVVPAHLDLPAHQQPPLLTEIRVKGFRVKGSKVRGFRLEFLF
jgi:hypothetical protein